MELFYIKEVAGSISLYFRPAHAYMEYFDTKEDCAEYIEEMLSLDESTFWRSILFDYKVRMPHRDVISGMRKDVGWRESEDGYNKAWKAQTDSFFEEFPDCSADIDIPFDLIREIHIAKLKEDEEREELLKIRKARSKRKITYVNGRIRIKKLTIANR